ncbi:hypothetical protein MycrhDRAFT_5709 [Mycolicibacterium rhodesiae JS60]|nr:hypothetical protein MycrhDRAFT_5709 [Mycolicibacterium rhodesiae JS60]
MGWARTAGYALGVDDQADAAVLRSEAGGPTRYVIRDRGAGRLELSQTDGDDVGGEERLLYAANRGVLERYLFGVFGDDIREDLALSFLEMPWTAADVAAGYAIAAPSRGSRILTHVQQGPVAAVPESSISLLALVPLSHFLLLDIPDLKRSFLHEYGWPLLERSGRYSSPRNS